MLNAHLRAGTVSKLYMADIVERMEVDGKFVSAVLIRRRINDPKDSRLIPPAVKGKEAIITIPLRLAQRIMQYIFTYRSDTANSDSSQQLSPFLFVNLSGQFAGLPMSRENIGRVIRKLNGPKVKKYRRVYPHILRHTGLTDTANHMEECGQDEKTIRAQLLLRGTWGAKSTMPERYTAGRIQRLGAELTEKRDADLEPKSTKV
jgi:hypothetical protein